MDILEIAYIANPILIFLMAIGLGLYLSRKYNLGWKLYFVGGATYLAAQIISILVSGLIQNITQSYAPALPVQLMLTLLFLFVLIGIEEAVRYGVYRWWVKDVRSWPEGLMLGAGHGGVEVILIGLFAITQVVQLIQLRHADLATIFSPDKLQDATNYVNTFWSKAWYNVFPEALRSAFTLPVQLACSLLVLQVFLRRQYRWLGIAIVWHVIASASLYFLPSDQYAYLPVIFLAIAGVISVGIIMKLRPQPEVAP